jgi:hypothetical protein
VFTAKADKPYFNAWLSRTRKQFAVSGRLSQTAFVLAQGEGGTAESWSIRLREILDGKESPSIDLLTRIDSILSGHPSISAAPDGQSSFW